MEYEVEILAARGAALCRLSRAWRAAVGVGGHDWHQVSPDGAVVYRDPSDLRWYWSSPGEAWELVDAADLRSWQASCREGQSSGSAEAAWEAYRSENDDPCLGELLADEADADAAEMRAAAKAECRWCRPGQVRRRSQRD